MDSQDAEEEVVPHRLEVAAEDALHLAEEEDILPLVDIHTLGEDVDAGVLGAVPVVVDEEAWEIQDLDEAEDRLQLQVEEPDHFPRLQEEHLLLLTSQPQQVVQLRLHLCYSLWLHKND